jgi:anthranilate phosphoribosyltransferase
LMRQTLRRLLEGQRAGEQELFECAREMAEGRASEAQMAALLAALKLKGEGVEELVAFARALRLYSVRIEPRVPGRLIDTCGTGGDGASSPNISTLSALVAAGAGARVAKHGNRSVTSRCGSADLLEALGFDLGAPPSLMKRAIEEVGIGFLFAPSFHPAMRHVAPVRKELGVRTIFNLLGPLLNPAGANAQLVGVYSAELVPKMAEALRRLGLEEAMVVHALEGMDEISVSGETLIARLRNGTVEVRRYTPEELGVDRQPPLPRIDGPEEGVSVALGVLRGSVKGPIREAVLVNSAAALIVAGVAGDFGEALQLARRSLDSGAALEKLRELVRLSRQGAGP